jgi:hypothetical protein
MDPISKQRCVSVSEDLECVPTDQSPAPATSHAASYDTGYAVDNLAAEPLPYGSVTQQAEQSLAMGYNTELAARNAVGAPGVDWEARYALKALRPSPPDLRGPTEFVNYDSTLHGVSPQDAFEYFKHNPQAWFGASGITLHPPATELTDGARVYLAEPGVTPPVFAPIEVHIDEQARTVSITTLDGHPLRGVNRFTFEQAANGETVLHQSSAFQLSSVPAQQGAELMKKGAELGVPGLQSPIERQHEIWRSAHANVADGAPRR